MAENKNLNTTKINSPNSIDIGFNGMKFHFLNVKIDEDGLMKKKQSDLDSYMIVRMSQQSVSELLLDENECKKEDVHPIHTSFIAGYNYLVFKLFPTSLSNTYDTTLIEGDKFLDLNNPETLVDWNNSVLFDLVKVEDQVRFLWQMHGLLKPEDKLEEFKQEVSLGRDIEVKILKILTNPESGEKYLFTQSGTRKIEDGICKIEYSIQLSPL